MDLYLRRVNGCLFALHRQFGKAQFVEVVRPEIVGTETGNGVNLSLLLGERDQNPVIDPVNASSATEFRLDVDEVGVLGQPAVSCHKYIWLR